MTTRNFIQCGQAYGSTPATITATLDGTVIFSGTIPTQNMPFPTLPDFSVTGVNLFTWTNTVDFSGTQSLAISVTGADLLLTDSFADHCVANAISAFYPFYSYNVGNVGIADPFSNVIIDGEVMQRGPDDEILSGQWYWTIPRGSTFTATLNVNAGEEPA